MDKFHDQGNDMKRERRPRLRVRVEFSAAQLRREANRSKHCKSRKLLALAEVADGESCATVAKRYSVSTPTVYYWVHCLNDRGVEDFGRRHRGGRKCHLVNRDGIGVEELATAAEVASQQGSKKLMAISGLLKEMPCGEVAREARITPSTLTGWIKRFNKGGISELVADNRMSSRSKVFIRRDISALEVREFAKTAPHRTSLRLAAVAHVLDGMKLADVAASLSVSKAAVSKWCRRFNQDGMEGLIDRWDMRADKASTR